MAGLYFHIPFCKQACSYCDFHFRVGLKDEERMTNALLAELEQEKGFPFQGPLDSVYFGGGTPSLLPPERIEKLLERSEAIFGIEEGAEITLEANPDDLDHERMKSYRRMGIDRLSIGVQSFDDELLRRFNRAHSGAEAESCLQKAGELGFRSWSADLIFGMPGFGGEILENDLRKLIELEVPHLSCYGLTIEPNTVLARAIERGEMEAPDGTEMGKAYERIMEGMEEAGYEHYEISNFALPSHRAVHNASYWTGEPYLGIGPSAHSFDGRERWWNVAKNGKYIRSVEEGGPERGKEGYDPIDRANERILTRIRTSRGLDPEELRSFGVDLRKEREAELSSMFEEGLLTEKEDRLTLTRQGKLLADRICERLFLLKDDR